MAADSKLGDLSEEEHMMFSLREIAENQFIYYCHGCSWESDPMTTEEAINYPRTHVCQPKATKEPMPQAPRDSACE